MVDIPEHLLKRSKDAKGKAGGAADAPADAPEPEEAAGAAEASEADAPAAAESSGIPAHLLARSKAARSKGGDEGDDAGGATKAATATKTPPAKAAPAAKPAAAGAGPARTQRLLAVVKAGSIQTTKKDPVDKVNVWPHLLVEEFVALLLVTAFLMVFSVLLSAPLQDQANPNLTPNPSKAPWYFLGLQELLTMFHPMVAGVTIPGIGIFALLAVPYIDRNPATKPSERKFAIAIFTFFLIYWSVLVMFGVFFRGPGFNFVWPWADGIFFDF
ncbi:MAG: menaquinol-cytochrome c reductase cytochrome b subunit [Acidimicrobiia bacterium]|nr:menaquinol-cytochrome c reductase cytochrome b subunit [Acidimicrobiia bacterium]